MKAVKWIAASAVLSISSTLFAGESSGVTVSHFEPLQRLSIASKSGDSSQKPAGMSRPVTLSFDALGKTFDLQLEPNTALIAAAQRSALAEGIEIYRGHMDGKPDSWARIVVFEGVPTGLIWDGEQLFAIEAPHDSALATSSAVIYRLADVSLAPGSMSCGSEMASGNAAETYQKLIGELGGAITLAPGAVEEMGLGAIGDFEFTTARGGDSAAAAAITARLNNVDGIFSSQLGVQLNLQTIETFSSAADPFSDTGDAGALLDELADYRLATPAQNSQGLTHLYTGRDLDTSTVGIAYTGVLCATHRGAGLSEGNGSATFDSLIAAHEIGHNFGAPHDGEAGSPCESEMGDFIMAPRLSGSSQFSACSITQMRDNIDRASCITPLPSVDMAVALNGDVSTLLLGANTVLEYDLANNGSLPATNVTANFTLPSTLSFESVTTSSGSCTNGAGTVDCVLGDVPGSTARTVTITTTPTSVGVGMLNASVSSDADDNLGNNDEGLEVTVDPAVDLVISAPAQVSIDIDQSTTVSTVLENRSVLDATGVTLAITLNAGLRADSASWTLGSCTVAVNRIDCVASDFAAEASATLNVGVTGVTSGSKRLPESTRRHSRAAWKATRTSRPTPWVLLARRGRRSRR